jgi:hypothetical protein
VSHERIAFIVSVLVLGGAIGMASLRVLVVELRRRRRRRRPLAPLTTTASLNQLVHSHAVRPLLEADQEHTRFTMRTRIETPTTALRKKA